LQFVSHVKQVIILKLLSDSPR